MPRVSITVPGKTPQPYRFELDRKKVTIGRSSSNDIVIECPSVSGSHCTMERVDGGYILRDQDSTNGLKLADEKMSIVDLRNGIEVLVGDAEFSYTLNDEELDDLDEEDFIPHARKASEKEQEDPETSARDERRRTNKPKVTPAPARPVATPPLPSASQSGGGLLALATVIFGFLAFYAGLDISYTNKQEKLGRKGEISLLQDIRDGRPPLPTEDENQKP